MSGVAGSVGMTVLLYTFSFRKKVKKEVISEKQGIYSNCISSHGTYVVLSNLVSEYLMNCSDKSPEASTGMVPRSVWTVRYPLKSYTMWHKVNGQGTEPVHLLSAMQCVNYFTILVPKAMPPETDEKILPTIRRLHYAHYKEAACWFTVVLVPLTPFFLQFIRQSESE